MSNVMDCLLAIEPLPRGERLVQWAAKHRIQLAQDKQRLWWRLLDSKGPVFLWDTSPNSGFCDHCVERDIRTIRAWAMPLRKAREQRQHWRTKAITMAHYVAMEALPDENNDNYIISNYCGHIADAMRILKSCGEMTISEDDGERMVVGKWSDRK